MKIFVLFFVGALAGTLLDGLQTLGGIAVYTNPFVLQTAWWVPFLFGFGVTLIGVTHFRIHPIPARKKSALWGSLTILILVCFVTAFLQISNFQKAAVLLAAYALSWGFLDATFWSLFLAAATAVFGCASEIFLSEAGVYRYTHPDLLGIPLWLPFLYFHVSAAAGFLGREWLSSRPDSGNLGTA